MMVHVSPHGGNRYLNGVRYSVSAHQTLSEPSKQAGKAFELVRRGGEWCLIELEPTFSRKGS